MKTRYKYLIIAVLAILVFGYLEWTPTLADPDSFYHARLAAMIKDNWEMATSGQFPWLYFTTWRDIFADHHFLYHLSVIPVISIVSILRVNADLAPLIAVKIAAIIFSTIFFLVFYWFLRREKIHSAFFYTCLLFFSRGLLFRFGLPKAPVISATILVLILYFLFQKKYWPLFILAFLYVWAYGGWPMMFVFWGFYVLAEIFKEKILRGPEFDFWRAVLRREIAAPIILLFLGTLAGIIFNPYFPQNIIFYFSHYFRILYTGFQHEVLVGVEWDPSDFSFLMDNAFILFVLGVVSGALFIYGIFGAKDKAFKKISEDQIVKIFTLSFIFSAFFVWTIEARRNIEYLVPFGVLFFAFLNNLNAEILKNPRAIFVLIFGKKELLGKFIVGMFVAVQILRAGFEISLVRACFADSYRLQKYRPAAEWLKTNSAPGEIVFNDNWSTFPMLFYWNTKNYYIFGEDPMAFWSYNKELYRAYADVVYKQKKENLAEIIRDKFHAKYVLVDMGSRQLDENLKHDGQFTPVYWDREVKIYAVKAQAD